MRTALLPFFLLLISADAYSGVIVTAKETAQGVLFEGAGTMDLANSTAGVGSSAPAGVDHDFYVLVGPPNGGRFDTYFPEEFSGPLAVGTGGFSGPDYGTGDLLGISWGRESLAVPEGYQSGSPLSGSMLLAGQTFTSTGLVQGTYVWEWSAGGGIDRFTLIIIPEPSAAFLFLAGCIPLVGISERRK